MILEILSAILIFGTTSGKQLKIKSRLLSSFLQKCREVNLNKETKQHSKGTTEFLSD